VPYQTILTEVRGHVGVVTLNRPEARNALNNQMIHELMDALEAFDANPDVGAMVLTGGEKAFAAGADIKEMAARSAAEMAESGFIAAFGPLSSIRKPIVAAVSGWALGGGCELALAADMIVASVTAKFGQPEITIGVIPGAGGTQRLPRAVGKAMAMEMILDNRVLSADEALGLGMVNHVEARDRYLDKAVEIAESIAGRAPLAVRAAKKMILQASETALENGLQLERDEFHSLFGTRDREEGMQAFVEKREPRWHGV
jgi:enoyl-CoA hydratase